MSADAAVRARRREAAVAWRTAHRQHYDRHWMWRAYTTGAIRGIGALPEPKRAAVRLGLADAERAVPFTAVLCGVQPAEFKVPGGCRLKHLHKGLHEVPHAGRLYRFTFVDGST